MDHDITSAGIVGAGAMGCLFAGLFHKAGIPVSIYETDPAKLQAMAAGITVRTSDEIVSIPVTVSALPSILEKSSIILLSVKSYSTENAITAISDHLGCSTVVTLQNGLGNVEIISAHVPPKRLVYGTTTLGAAQYAPGEVTPGGMGEIVIGGVDSSTVSRAASLFQACGIAVAVTDRPDNALWEKAVINAAINPLGALMNIPNGEIVQSAHLRMIQEMVILESCQAADAAGIVLDAGSLMERTRATCIKTAGNRCSMLQDILNRRRTEIDSITGAIVRQGIVHGLSLPVNETLYMLVKSRENLPQSP